MVARGGGGRWGEVDRQSVPAVGGSVETRPRAGADGVLEIEGSARPLLSNRHHGFGRVTAPMTEPMGDGAADRKNRKDRRRRLARVASRTAGDTRPFASRLLPCGPPGVVVSCGRNLLPGRDDGLGAEKNKLPGTRYSSRSRASPVISLGATSSQADRRKNRRRLILARPQRGRIARHDQNLLQASGRQAGLSPASFIVPMKARSTERVPVGSWRWEIKFDGYRAVAVLNAGRAELRSRNRLSLSAAYSEIVRALRELKCRDAVRDGEIAALDAGGSSRFQLLQGLKRPGVRPPLVYYLFDLLHRDGQSFLGAPIGKRRAQLVSPIGRARGTLQLSKVFSVEPSDLLAAARAQRLEGIVAKRPGSRYEPDRRSGSWVKCKLVAEQEFVVGGFTRPKNSREYFGAVLVGYYRKGKLIYAGKVGTGFDRARLRALHAKFLQTTRAGCPFENLPMAERPRFGEGMNATAMKAVTWLKPETVVQVKFAEWTAEGLLRQPVFLGERTDKKAKGVHRENTLA